MHLDGRPPEMTGFSPVWTSPPRKPPLTRWTSGMPSSYPWTIRKEWRTASVAVGVLCDVVMS